MSKIDTSSLSERIEAVLKEEIIDGRFTPGQKLDLEQLASRWSVSITPIRDAIRRLETTGLVRVAPRRGVYVATANYQRFKETFELRIALECLAIRSATMAIPPAALDAMIARCHEAVRVRRATGDHRAILASDQPLHDLILRSCDNRKLIEIMDGLSDLNRWMRNIIAQDPAAYDAAADEHDRLLTALKEHDIAAAEEAMRVHLLNSLIRSRPFWDGAGRAQRLSEEQPEVALHSPASIYGVEGGDPDRIHS